MTEDGNGGFPFPQMNRCPIGTEAAAAQYQAGTSWNRGFLPAMAGASALIKEREDEGHLKETAANQTGDVHTHSQHTQASSHRGKVNMSIHADNTGKETCHQQKHTSHTAFNQDGYFSCQMFVK